VYCSGSSSYLSVDFGSSLKKAVLKAYQDVDDASTMSPACLEFSVHHLVSPAVRLLVIVSNMSDDSAIGAVHSHNNASDHHLVITGTGKIDRRRRRTMSVTVVRGQQYVTLTAEKTKVTKTSDRIMLSQFQWDDGPCRDYSSGK